MKGSKSAEGIVENANLFKGVVKMSYSGKYRGVVTDNQDPSQSGRIKAKVPSVLGAGESGWAVPCVPYAGKGVGFLFIPPVGANVWIEFEEGDPQRPIWSGGFWGPGEAPKTPAAGDVKLIKTDFATITIKDSSGANGIAIETSTGLKIIMDASGIELVNGASSVKLTPADVSINKGALQVI